MTVGTQREHHASVAQCTSGDSRERPLVAVFGGFRWKAEHIVPLRPDVPAVQEVSLKHRPLTEPDGPDMMVIEME
jgi:hypothetical protein